MLDQNGYRHEKRLPTPNGSTRSDQQVNGHAGTKAIDSKLGASNAAALMWEDLPPIRYIVPNLIAEGLTLLGGKAKLGKSWLLLGTAIAVAMGGYALSSIRVEQGDVLYLALEDNKRRLQKRLRQLLP